MNKATILIVEDDNIFSAYLQSILSNLGYEVLKASGIGEEAIASADALKPDLVLMDIVLAGEMDGIEAAKIIHDTLDIPVIYVTGNADIDTVKRAREANPYGYVMKPVNMLDLFTSIDTALHRFGLQKKLKESEEKYRSLVESSSDWIWSIDQNGFYTYSSPKVKDVLGYEPYEITGKSVLSFSPPDEIARLNETIKHLFKSRKPFYLLENVNIHKDGSRVMLETSAVPLFDEKGNFKGYQGVDRDITDRKHAETVLRENEERFRALVQNLQDIIAIINIEGTVIYENPVTSRTLGYSLLGKNYANLIHPDDLATAMHDFEDVVKGINPHIPTLVRIKQADGSWIHLEILATNLYDNTTIQGGLFVCRNVTDRINAQKALNESEEKYRTILESMDEGLYETDMKGNYTFVNEAGCRIVGYECDELIGKNARMLHSRETLEYIVSVYNGMMKTGKTGILMDYEAIRKDGSITIHQANATFILDETGKRIGTRALVRDVTDRRKAEDALRQSEEKYRTVLENTVEERTRELKNAYERLADMDRIKTNFFANISHEIRTPLTLILSPVETALQGDYPKEIDRTFLENIQKNAIRLLRLINNLLDFSKIEAGKMNVTIKEIDIVPILRNYVSALQYSAESKGITLNLKIENSPIRLYLDIEKFDKVAMNIFSNALKFTDKGGKIEIWIKDEDTKCVIEVEDSGIGIPPEKLGTIFERFSQVDISSTRKYEGTGIGLSLAKELIELLGGSISVESRFIGDHPKGHGTLFVMTFPKGKQHFSDRNDVEFLAESEFAESISDQRRFVGVREMLDIQESNDDTVGTEDIPETALLQDENNAPLKVLVVEDNPDMRDFLKTLLQEHYRVFSAVDGLDGLNTTKELEPDVIVTDVMMPNIDGYTMTKMLKENASLKRIPVLMLTAKADIAHKIEGLEYGADDYLTKPFNSKELLVRIKMLLKTREYEKIIEARNEEIENELVTARLLQQKLLPESIPVISGYQSHITYIPMDQVGGDFYDFKANDDFIELFIADVTGHGLHGAFISMITKMAFESIRERKSPRNVLYILNDVICRSTVQSNFVTIFYCIINRATNVLTYSNAGHMAPLIFRRIDGIFGELKPTGMPLGLSKTMEIGEEKMQLNSGDRMILYTDGITECGSSHRNMFGEEGLKDFICSNMNCTPKTFSESLLSHLKVFQHGNKFKDDVCLMVLDVL